MCHYKSVEFCVFLYILLYIARPHCQSNPKYIPLQELAFSHLFQKIKCGCFILFLSQVARPAGLYFSFFPFSRLRREANGPSKWNMTEVFHVEQHVKCSVSLVEFMAKISGTSFDYFRLKEKGWITGVERCCTYRDWLIVEGHGTVVIQIKYHDIKIYNITKSKSVIHLNMYIYTLPHIFCPLK